jgi:hypothetical protein
MKLTLRLIALLSISVFVLSCKKSSDSSSSGYYFKGDFNGKSKSFNTSVLATKSNLGGGYYSIIIGGATTAESSAITLWSNQDDFVAGKTYGIESVDNTTFNSLSYISPLGSAAPSSIWNTSYDGNVTQSFTCTITEATSTNIKGTFSGLIYMQTDSAVVMQNVTNGEFNAKFY